MHDTSIPQPLKYLVDTNDFIVIVNAVFAEYIPLMQVEGLYLFQISADESHIRNIAESVKDDSGIQMPGELAVSEMAFLNHEMVIVDHHRMGNLPEGYRMLFAPVYIREKAAMYVGAMVRELRFSQEQLTLLSQVTLLIQSIAAQKNFEDSLESSYRLLEDVLDEIPTGVAVLDKNEKEVLLMNHMAAESIAVQNAMGMGLERYTASGEIHIDEIYEKETGLWFDVQFNNIQWINGEHVLICTAIDVTQKIKNQQRIEYQANNDYLTGLFNRMKCERDLSEIIENSVKTGERGVLLFLDLDNFKQVNDGLGHQYGDVLLQEIASGIQSIQHIENSCYRLGGDEFVIIIRPEVFGEITRIVEKISHMFNKPWTIMEVEYYCTMSMGLAIFPDHGTTVQDIIKKADYAMYEAKKGGKNRYLWYEENKSEGNKEQKELEETIRTAVVEEFREFELFYQPVVDVDGAIMGAEALLRLNSEKYGRMMPVEFIPVAEYLGLISHIGNFVLRDACKTLKEWNDRFDSNLKMHINISSVQLMSPYAVERIMGIIRESGADATNVVLDLSETAEFRDEDKAFSTLDILRAHGVKVSLDDFGTGDVSLSLLKRLDTYVVKVDSSFIKNAASDVFKNSVIHSVCAMSKDMKFKVCFEGVETEQQKEFATSAGADFMEGYLFGTAMHKIEFEKELMKEKNRNE